MDTMLRNANFTALHDLLVRQQARKLDLVVPSSAIFFVDGQLNVLGAEPIMDTDGVTEVNGVYVPTPIFDEGLSSKLEIPLPYLRRMRTSRLDLLDANLNGWLHGTLSESRGDEQYDPRRWLLRCYRADDALTGVARAFLSDSFKMIDNFDVLMAALAGVKQAGVEVEIVGCDLSERRMSVRMAAPGVKAHADKLLGEYLSPFRDPELDAQRQHSPMDRVATALQTWGSHSGVVTDPVVFAGFEIGNSETGNGAYTLSPRIVFKVCNNGAKITWDQLRRTHLGGKLEEGVISWTQDTQAKNLDLVTAMTRDAVTTFLSEDYLNEVIGKLEEKAGVKVTDATETIKVVAKKLAYDEETAKGILDHFTRGGQMTAGGILNAVTSYAQVVADPDKAAELENTAVRAMELAAA